MLRSTWLDRSAAMVKGASSKCSTASSAERSGAASGCMSLSLYTGTSWEPWAFDDWGPSKLSAGTEHAGRAAWVRGPQPSAADLLDNRERAWPTSRC